MQFRIEDNYYIRGNDYWTETLHLIRNLFGEMKKLGLKKTNFDLVARGVMEIDKDKKTLIIFGDAVEGNRHDEFHEKSLMILRPYFEGYDLKYDKDTKITAVWLDRLNKLDEQKKREKAEAEKKKNLK